VLIGLFLLQLPAGTIDAASPTASPWSSVPTAYVSGENFLIQAMASPAAGDVWAVGYHYESVGGATEFRTLAEHYNGTRFIIVPTPDRETNPPVDMLMGAAGAAADDVWAVGSSSPAGQPAQTLIEHWNGTAWAIVPSPDPGSRGDNLEGVAALGPDNVWAVGARQNAGNFFERPLALHWNGTAWTSKPVPNAPGCTGHSYLTAVTAVATSNAWATGWCGSGGNGPTFAYIEHWNGTNWSVAAGRGITPTGSELFGISAVGAYVWAVGFSQVPGNDPPVALSLHLVDSAWQAASVPEQRTPVPAAVLALANGGAFAVGAADSPQPPFAGPYSMKLVAGAWHSLSTPPAFGRLTSISRDSSGALWAGGFSIATDGTDRALVLMGR
jgi:hypothetical protein